MSVLATKLGSSPGGLLSQLFRASGEVFPSLDIQITTIFKDRGGSCLNRTRLEACSAVWMLCVLLFCPAWAILGGRCQVLSSSPFLSGLLWPSVMIPLFYVLSSDSFTHGLMGSHPFILQVLTVNFAGVGQVRY